MGEGLSRRQLLRRLRPSAFGREMGRVARKAWRRLSRIEKRIVRLEPTTDAVRGDALVAYIVDGVLGAWAAEDADLPVTHTHYWETRQIVRTFLDLGYRVDVVHWTNDAFVPRKPYDVALDVRRLLPLWDPHLPRECVRIFHGETSHAAFNDRAAARRHRELEERRGADLPFRKAIGGAPSFDLADAATILGDETTVGTYRDVRDDLPIVPVTISAPTTYERFGRDFGDGQESCRRRYLWLGSEGLVHKGLDLVLEAFAAMPDFHLTVCGPISRERAFERVYWKELFETPNIDTAGWIDVTSEEFERLASRTLGLVYPSAAEGQCGSVVTCLHAGLVPVVSDRTGVPIDESFGVVVPEPLEAPGTEAAENRVESIRRAVRELSERGGQELQSMSDAARRYARENHTKETFARVYREAIEEILEPVEKGLEKPVEKPVPKTVER